MKQVAGGALTEETKEERKGPANAEYMANMNKKQKRMFLLQEKMRNQTKAIMSKRSVLVHPDTERWPRIDPTMLRMEKIRI